MPLFEIGDAQSDVNAWKANLAATQKEYDDVMNEYNRTPKDDKHATAISNLNNSIQILGARLNEYASNLKNAEAVLASQNMGPYLPQITMNNPTGSTETKSGKSLSIGGFNLPSWVLPVAAVGGGLILFTMMKKKLPKTSIA